MQNHGTCRLALAAALFLASGAEAQQLADAASSDIAHGKRVFEIHCARCHGLDGVGGEGPNLMRENLRRAGTDDALLAIVEDGIPGTDMPGHFSLNTGEIRSVAAYVRSLGVAPREDLPGDPARGRDLYEATLCSSCHIVNGEGIAFGPDLSNIGLLRGSAFLRESVADPSRVVAPRYRAVRIEDENGADILGIRVSEDTFTVQVLDQAGRLRSFRKAAVREYVPLPEESLMMTYADFREEELDDLVAFLASLRGSEGDPR